MKKIIKIIISIIVFILLVFMICSSLNYRNYKKVNDILNDSLVKTEVITNVKISTKEMSDDKDVTKNKDNYVVIKGNRQCDTNDRKKYEENGIDYRLLDFNNKISYTIVSNNEKSILIRKINLEELYFVELLRNIPASDYSIINGKTYSVKEEKIDNEDCYKITIKDKKDDINLRNYWICKENGLLYKTEMNNTVVEYSYEFDTVTDEDVRSINLDEYTNYVIKDER